MLRQIHEHPIGYFESLLDQYEYQARKAQSMPGRNGC